MIEKRCLCDITLQRLALSFSAMYWNSSVLPPILQVSGITQVFSQRLADSNESHCWYFWKKCGRVCFQPKKSNKLLAHLVYWFCSSLSDWFCLSMKIANAKRELINGELYWCPVKTGNCVGGWKPQLLQTPDSRGTWETSHDFAAKCWSGNQLSVNRWLRHR